MRIWFSALLMALAFSLSACASAELGEECDTAGEVDECVDDAICTNSSDGNVCRKVCTKDDSCAADEECNGVSGSTTKSCQPKKVK